MAPSVYKKRVRLRSEQEREIIPAPDGEVADIDAPVKDDARQTLGKESAAPMRDVQYSSSEDTDAATGMGITILSLTE